MRLSRDKAVVAEMVDVLDKRARSLIGGPLRQAPTLLRRLGDVISGESLPEHGYKRTIS